jgi:hypothetical protein
MLSLSRGPSQPECRRPQALGGRSIVNTTPLAFALCLSLVASLHAQSQKPVPRQLIKSLRAPAFPAATVRIVKSMVALPDSSFVDHPVESLFTVNQLLRHRSALYLWALEPFKMFNGKVISCVLRSPFSVHLREAREPSRSVRHPEVNILTSSIIFMIDDPAFWNSTPPFP